MGFSPRFPLSVVSSFLCFLLFFCFFVFSSARPPPPRLLPNERNSLNSFDLSFQPLLNDSYCIIRFYQNSSSDYDEEAAALWPSSLWLTAENSPLEEISSLRKEIPGPLVYNQTISLTMDYFNHSLLFYSINCSCWSSGENSPPSPLGPAATFFVKPGMPKIPRESIIIRGNLISGRLIPPRYAGMTKNPEGNSSSYRTLQTAFATIVAFPNDFLTEENLPSPEELLRHREFFPSLTKSMEFPWLAWSLAFPSNGTFLLFLVASTSRDGENFSPVVKITTFQAETTERRKSSGNSIDFAVLGIVGGGSFFLIFIVAIVYFIFRRHYRRTSAAFELRASTSRETSYSISTGKNSEMPGRKLSAPKDSENPVFVELVKNPVTGHSECVSLYHSDSFAHLERQRAPSAIEFSEGISPAIKQMIENPLEK